jgi:hypothetical protein
MGDLLSTVAPPLPDMWIEFDGVPNRLNLRAWGVHLVVVAGPGVDISRRPDGVPDEARWVVAFAILGEWTKGDIVGQIADGGFLLDASGVLIGGDPPGERAIDLRLGGDDVLEARMADDHVAFYLQRVQELLYAALLAVSFCHCKNVDQTEVAPAEKASRAFRRRHGRPLTRYRVLDIEPMKGVLATEGQAESRGLGHALHICRGHFKTFTPEAPLFGRLTGTYWWADHVRGSADLGAVDKDYRLVIDEGTLGRPFEPVAEHHDLTSAPQNRGSDPDHAGWGLAAHNRTLNLPRRWNAVVTGHGDRNPMSRSTTSPGKPQTRSAWPRSSRLPRKTSCARCTPRSVKSSTTAIASTPATARCVS